MDFKVSPESISFYHRWIKLVAIGEKFGKLPTEVESLLNAFEIDLLANMIRAEREAIRHKSK